MGRTFTKIKSRMFTRDWAAQQFGLEHAAEIAELLAKFGKYAGRRKHELIDPTTFSVVNYDEADRVVAEWTELTNSAESLAKELSADKQDAFFELVLHPIKASSILTEMYVAAAKNKLYAAQGRASANEWAKKVHELIPSRPRSVGLLQPEAGRRQMVAHDGPKAHRLHHLARTAAKQYARGERDHHS